MRLIALHPGCRECRVSEGPLGTPESAAPEVINYEPIGYATDMWSIRGHLLYPVSPGATRREGPQAALDVEAVQGRA